MSTMTVDIVHGLSFLSVDREGMHLSIENLGNLMPLCFCHLVLSLSFSLSNTDFPITHQSSM